ncbi:MAG: hypothetical protein M3347_10400, partial [Armatimonadota bacterium]|nr:hypothetical protein [Armatimonadota bacterium]
PAPARHLLACRGATIVRSQSMSDFHPSAVAAIQTLRERYPQTPFLTLGQTVLWDEPTKAAFCRMLEEVAPEALMVAAVHDTDYFAKLPRFENRAEKFVLLPHNDGDTRGLWSAAGELSCLFGSETVPTRQLLTENGVAFDRVARDYPGGVEALLNQETNAWGWLALVHTEPHPLIAADVKLRDIGPVLLQQLEWGLGESLRIVQSRERTPFRSEPGNERVERNATASVPYGVSDGQSVAAVIIGWVQEYLALDVDGTLSDLYRWLTPRLWALVRGEGSCNLQTGSSLQLFRFNRATASRPRFRFADLFLQPATRELAGRCYDEAVRGSGIYALDRFGPGALPFDVVIPGRGRGTLRLHQGSLYIETEEPITLCTGCDCGSIEQLADALEDTFDDGVALVGKAVALISMLAHEFIFVFHEKASGYTARTQKMNAALRAAGVDLPLHPLLRLKYATWNALETSNAIFHLPAHLAAAFKQADVTAQEFARRWESVCDEQDQLRAALKACSSPRDLMALFARQFSPDWQEKLTDYNKAREVIHATRARTSVLEDEVTTLREKARAGKRRVAEIERAKGEDFRARVQPLRTRLFDIKEAAAQRLNPAAETGKPRRLTRAEREAEAQRAEQEAREIEALRARIAELQQERAHFDQEIAAQRRVADEAQATAKEKIAERVALERSAEVVAARRTIAPLLYEAQLERLRRTRDAITVSHGLRYTNSRPTAWWLPLVSPDGHWFDRLARTAEARIEEI